MLQGGEENDMLVGLMFGNCNRVKGDDELVRFMCGECSRIDEDDRQGEAHVW